MSEPIDQLHAEALDEELGRHFTTAIEEVAVGAARFVIRKPENADHLISEADYVGEKFAEEARSHLARLSLSS